MTDPTFSTDRGDGVMPEMKYSLERPEVDPRQTAIVVVDMVNWQVGVHDGALLTQMSADGVDVSYIIDRVQRTVIPNTARLLEAARSQGVRVAFLRLGCYQRDYSDALPNLQKMFREAGARDGSFACEVVEGITVEPGDISLVKTGTGGFYSSGIDTHLRNMGIRHVAYTGVVTNACVLSTAVGGYDRGYYGYVVGDCTATFSETLQKSTEDMLSGYLARVVTTDEFVGLVQTPATAGVAAGR